MKNYRHLFEDNRTENLFQVLNKCSKVDRGKAVTYAYDKHSWLKPAITEIKEYVKNLSKKKKKYKRLYILQLRPFIP